MAGLLEHPDKKRAMNAARLFIHYGYPLPTDVYLKLHTHGVDIEEFERTVRNGEA